MQHQNCWTNELVISSLTSQMILIAYNTLEIVLRISLEGGITYRYRMKNKFKFK